jgi:8-oxo-dGTP pyrophosphatase MutT (NUDIX family)
MKFPIDETRLRRALHPLAELPTTPGWNTDELHDLLPHDAANVEAAVLVGLVPRETGFAVVLTRRTDALRQHAGQVSFPGGRIEADDADPVAAALREAHEEIGLQHRQATPWGYLDPLSTVTGYRVLPLVAGIDLAFVAKPDPNEVAEVFEVPLDYLMTPANLARIDIQYRGRPRHVLEYRSYEHAPEQRIWGATASILFNLRQRLEDAS